jgi:RNA polymerase sigma-70 factor (ECF subfamily)
MMNRTDDNILTDTAQSEHLLQPTDEELLIAYRQNHESALFTELVTRYQRELYNYLRRFLGDPAMAEDAFQSTFLQVHLKCAQFEVDRKFRPWLYTIATNQAIDAQRRNQRHRILSLDRTIVPPGMDHLGPLLQLMESKEPDPTSQMVTAEREAWIDQAVEQLPLPLRTVIELVYFQALKYREAAEVLNIPVGTVKSRLHAAILKLNQAWRQSHRSGVE